MFKTTRRWMTAAMVLTVAVAGAGLARAQEAALKLLPSDTQAIIMAKSLKSLDNKISNMTTQLGVQAPPNAITSLVEGFGVADAIDMDGALVIALLPKSKDQPQGKPPVVVLIPAKDGKALLTPFQPTDPKDGLITITGPQGDEMTAALLNKYVVVGQTPEVVKQFLASPNKLDGVIKADLKQVFSANDLTIYANTPEINKAYGNQIAGVKLMAMEAIKMQKDPNAPLVQAMAALFFDGVKNYLTQSDAGVVGVRLTDDSVNLSVSGHFKPGSDIAKLVAAQKAAKVVDLTGLPAGKYMAAFSMAWDDVSVGAQITKAVNDILKYPALAQSPMAAKATEAMTMQAEIAKLTRGVKGVMLEPVLDSKEGKLNFVGIYALTDAVKAKALIHKFYDSSVLDFGTQAKGLKTTIKAEKDALKVAGMSFDKLTITAQVDETTATPEEAEMIKKTLAAMYGENGTLTYYIGFDAKNLLAVMGNEDLLKKAVTSYQSNDGALEKDAGVIAGKKMLKNSNMMVAYMPVASWVELAKKAFLPEMADPAGDPAAPKTTALPMMMGMGATDTALTTEIVMPMSTIKMLVKEAQALQGQ